MKNWPPQAEIRERRRAVLLRARARRNLLIAAREHEQATSRPLLRNVVLSAREDKQSGFLRAAARFYRLALRTLQTGEASRKP